MRHHAKISESTNKYINRRGEILKFVGYRINYTKKIMPKS